MEQLVADVAVGACHTNPNLIKCTLELRALSIDDQGVKVIGVDTHGFDLPLRAMVEASVRTCDPSHLWPCAAATYKVGFKRPDMELTEETFPAFMEEANRRAGPLFFHEGYPEVARRVAASWQLMPLKVHRNLVQLVHPDLRENVPMLTMPTLVVVGQDDRSTTVEHAQWIHEHLPTSELFVVPGTAHFMYMEKPVLVAERVLQFLGSPAGAAERAGS